MNSSSVNVKKDCSEQCLGIRKCASFGAEGVVWSTVFNGHFTSFTVFALIMYERINQFIIIFGRSMRPQRKVHVII